MSKPMSEDAILVAKALKNFDPEKYFYFNLCQCVAGQSIDWRQPEQLQDYCKVSKIVGELHDKYAIAYEDGKGIEAKLREIYNLG